MKRLGFLFVVGLTVTLLGACKEGSVSGIGGGGAGGTGGAGPGGHGGGCVGDAAKWASITAGPFTCTKNSDCCVVFNDCLSQAQIVKAADYDAAKTAWPYCQDECAGCIAPAVKIACQSGTCVGETVDPSTEPPSELRQDHCGVDSVPVGTPSSLTKFGCGD